MPEILHTVLLAETRHVTAFIEALRMQKTFVDQQQHDLSLNYATCVHKMWIGEFRGPMHSLSASFISSFTPSAPELDSGFDVSLLAPVILAAPSLVINFGSLDILYSCLKHMCNSDVDHRNSPLPWSTKSLTFSGTFSGQWWPFLGGNRSQDFRSYLVPLWMARVLFKGLQTFSLAIPHIKIPAIGCAFSDKEIWVKLVTLPASMLPEPWTLEEMKTFLETGEGTNPLVQLPVFLSVSSSVISLGFTGERLHHADGRTHAYARPYVPNKGILRIWGCSTKILGGVMIELIDSSISIYRQRASSR
ncbi:hypothetical protein BDR03DRAFT_981938 [Suillus americanus]|nr:hypothetical protein BDR03DRAFT_981938 [Suillus americanus]